MKDFKLIISGSKNFNDYDKMKIVIDNLLSKVKQSKDIVIISGTKSGAERLGEIYAFENNYRLLWIPPKINKFNEKAEYMRDYEMVDRADACVIFHVNNSKDSVNMIEAAQKKNIILKVINC